MIIEVLAVFGVVVANVICYAAHEKSLLRGKVHFPSLLLISNRADAFHTVKPRTYWTFDALEPAHLVTSYVLNDIGVFLLRIAELMFFVLTLVFEGTTGDGFGNPGFWFTFFTNWTFLIFGVWSVLGIMLTGWDLQAKINAAQSVRKSQEEHMEEAEMLNSSTAVSSSELVQDPNTLPNIRWSPWSVGYCLVAETNAACTLFLSVFYWTFLFSPRAALEIDNILKHGVNNILILLDVALTRQPLVTYHYQVSLWYGTGYLLFMWIYHGASTHWVYWVLDWSMPSALVLYLLLPLMLFAAFMFWYLVAAIREWIGRWLQKRQGYVDEI